MIFILLLARAFASDFQITAPPQWQEILPAKEFREFRNVQAKTDERVVLFSQPGEGEPVERVMLENARRDVFESAGLKDYAVLSVEERGGCQEIRAVYRAAREIQTLERRCSSGGRQTHAFYLREGAALNEIARARSVLDNFKPLARRRPASEVADPQTAPAVTRLVGDEAAQRRFCERVPPARRRDFDGKTLSQVETALDVTVLSQNHCLRGAILDSAWELLKSTAEYNWALLKYRFNPTYRGEVNAAVSLVAAEVRKDASGFMAKIGSQIAKATKDSGIEFMSCLKPAEQIRVFCKIAAGLIPGGLLSKLGSKAPLAAEESLKVAKIVREGMALEKPAAPPAVRYIQLGDGPDGPRVILPDKAPNVTEKIPAAPQVPPRDTPMTTEGIRPSSVPAATDELVRVPPTRPDIQAEAVKKFNPAVEKLAPAKNGEYFDQTATSPWRQWSGTDVDKLPNQGWKLHVSVEPESALAVTEAVLPELRRRGIGHKVINDLDYYRKIDPKNTQAGKFITVYPNSDKEAREIAILLNQILRERGFRSADFTKPPTEHQFYPGVTGRYGLHKPQKTKRLVDGVETSDYILLPDGRVVLDNRKIAFPPGIEIP